MPPQCTDTQLLQLRTKKNYGVNGHWSTRVSHTTMFLSFKNAFGLRAFKKNIYITSISSSKFMAPVILCGTPPNKSKGTDFFISARQYFSKTTSPPI